MRGKSSPGEADREMAAGASHQGNLEETGPGGDRLKQCSRPGRCSPLPEARMTVRGKVSRTSNGPGKQGGTADFSVPLEGRIFFISAATVKSTFPTRVPIPEPIEKDQGHDTRAQLKRKQR